VPKDTPAKDTHAERRAKRDVGRRVAELRERAGLTQDQLAARMACTDKYIQKVERGGYNLTLETLVKLAKALGARWRELCRAPQSRARRRPGRPRRGLSARSTLPVRER
jgi:UDP-N-acetylglucosamine 1-carboxyvinyltransferase